MSYYRATEQDQKQAENIRRQYISRDDNKMEQLKNLDSRVKLPGKIVSSIMGAVGVLVMGAGMSLIMVWADMQLGLILSFPGIAVALLAYPVYALITNGRKKKYAAEIMRLSDDVLKK